ncbi:MAG: hypothetical protein Q9M13_06955 [Mariprofundales bacterium]|nr:hypothetical protein [Mariprofundales bacterium]
MSFPALHIQRSALREEGFWPSFTDIMMVIVMIFLMAMLGLLLRNMDLVSKLQLALVEAQNASQQVEQTSSANHDLSARLVQSEQSLEMMRAQLMDVSRQRKEAESQLHQVESLVASLQQRNQQLQSDNRVQSSSLAELRQHLEQRSLEAERLVKQHAQQLQEERQQRQQAQQQLQQKEVDMARMERELAAQQLKSRQMRDDYSELASKYRRLIRPARSSLGKVVVAVRYLRRSNQLKIAVQLPDRERFVDVDSVHLHQLLSQLKSRWHKKLYVRILFPKDSGLSYSEAWQITESLLRLYDYYYQE